LFVKKVAEQVKSVGFPSGANSWWVDSNWKRFYELLDAFGTEEAWL